MNFLGREGHYAQDNLWLSMVNAALMLSSEWLNAALSPVG
jgi:hypothetical protein